jgi:hypothetical protein
VKIEQVITTINRMQADGVIDQYAIGGAVGATFYLEPVSTVDVDIFVAFTPDPGSVLINPRKIYDYLTAEGCAVTGEYIMIAGWPVQFLPPTGPLVEEALAEAETVDISETPARVFSAEHLAAVALETGRAKDKARLLMFLESGVLNVERFKDIVARHGLTSAWERFENQFMENEP